MTLPPTVAGLVLAGGRGSRMRASLPKPLLRLGDRVLAEHAAASLASLDTILVSANDLQAYEALGLPLVPDRRSGFAGPLAGLEAAAFWLRTHRRPVTHVLSVPGDTPFLPHDLLARLLAGDRTLPSVASFAGRLQPTVALWPMAALDRLGPFLDGLPNASIRAFLAETGSLAVEFEPSETAPDGDPFFNVNTPEDLDRAVAHWKRGGENAAADR